MKNLFSITLKKIRNNVDLELTLDEKKLNYYTDNVVDGIIVRDFGNKQVVEINADIIKKAEVHIFTTELHETVDRAGDSVIEVRNGDMLLDRTIVAKLGTGYGYKVFEISNHEHNIKHTKYK